VLHAQINLDPVVLLRHSPARRRLTKGIITRSLRRNNWHGAFSRVGTPEAQKTFEKGVALLHSFW